MSQSPIAAWACRELGPTPTIRSFLIVGAGLRGWFEVTCGQHGRALGTTASVVSALEAAGSGAAGNGWPSQNVAVRRSRVAGQAGLASANLRSDVGRGPR